MFYFCAGHTTRVIRKVKNISTGPARYVLSCLPPLSSVSYSVGRMRLLTTPRGWQHIPSARCIQRAGQQRRSAHKNNKEYGLSVLLTQHEAHYRQRISINTYIRLKRLSCLPTFTIEANLICRQRDCKYVSTENCD